MRLINFILYNNACFGRCDSLVYGVQVMKSTKQGSMLTGPAIREAISNGKITCDPYVVSQVAQASIDVHLHPTLLIYRGTYAPTSKADCPAMPLAWTNDSSVLSLAEAGVVDRFEIPEEGIVLMPGVFYLGATIEKLGSDSYALLLDGKSSVGRKGMKVHFTAGFIEPGFVGQITMEIEVSVPLRVYYGWPIAQIRVHTLVGQIEKYVQRGHYTGVLSEGPVASQGHLHERRHVKADK